MWIEYHICTSSKNISQAYILASIHILIMHFHASITPSALLIFKLSREIAKCIISNGRFGTCLNSKHIFLVEDGILINRSIKLCTQLSDGYRCVIY